MEKVTPIDVQKPKLTMKNAGRSTGLLIGLILFGIGVLMMVSIVLFIPGIFGVLVGGVISVMSVPKTDIKCPACDYVNKAAPPTAGVECERCKTNLPVKWVK